MKLSHFSGFALLLGLHLALGGLAAAQDNPPATAPSNSDQKAPPAKPKKKTWTDDDMRALHSPADSYADQKQAPGQKPADDAVAKTSSVQEPARDKPPLLSDPKTVESADKMIVWEDRDIAAQEEFVARLKTQLETAAPEDRDHLQQVIVERQQIIADTRRERDGLVVQKKALQKKAAPHAVTSASQPQE